MRTAHEILDDTHRWNSYVEGHGPVGENFRDEEERARVYNEVFFCLSDSGCVASP
jgi:hypothetical protein